VGPLGTAHRLMKDDVYEGKFIPAGSIVFGNAWAILHDENIYKDPQMFSPERFLKDGQLDPEVKSPEAAFGFGRRICPGRHFVMSSLFLGIACVLSTFDIENTVDENGNIIIPEGEYTSGMARHPLPFTCSIKPRSERALNLVINAYSMYHPC